LIGSTADITERKQAEAVFARQKEIIETSFENMDQGVSMFDDDLNLIVANGKFGELLEFPADLATVGVSLADLFRYNAALGEYGPGDADDQVAERIALARKFEAHQFERSRHDGMVMEIIGKPIESGGFVTTYSDITARKR
jgi:PAS domain-containing protein